jgi:hypothetical protein
MRSYVQARTKALTVARTILHSQAVVSRRKDINSVTMYIVPGKHACVNE